MLQPKTIEYFQCECDFPDCENVAPAGTTKTIACDLAKAAGWVLVGNVKASFCSEHTEEALKD